MRARAKRVRKWLHRHGADGMYGIHVTLARKYVYIYCRDRLLIQIDKVSYYMYRKVINELAEKVCREDRVVEREVK